MLGSDGLVVRINELNSQEESENLVSFRSDPLPDEPNMLEIFCSKWRIAGNEEPLHCERGMTMAYTKTAASSLTESRNKRPLDP